MDAVRITRHEHSTLELGLSCWIRWSVPLLCVQLTCLSCPIMNQKVGLLSNALRADNLIDIDYDRKTLQYTQRSPLALHPYVLLRLNGDWKEVSTNWTVNFFHNILEGFRVNDTMRDAVSTCNSALIPEYKATTTGGRYSARSEAASSSTIRITKIAIFSKFAWTAGTCCWQLQVGSDHVTRV